MSTAAFVGIATDGKKLIGSFEAIAPFAGSHRVIASSVEDCW
tara:strand:- start:1175 stop:1300 length:126 start_codon:yes stop_codon:yes gene_type:complete